MNLAPALALPSVSAYTLSPSQLRPTPLQPRAQSKHGPSCLIVATTAAATRPGWGQSKCMVCALGSSKAKALLELREEQAPGGRAGAEGSQVTGQALVGWGKPGAGRWRGNQWGLGKAGGRGQGVGRQGSSC